MIEQRKVELENEDTEAFNPDVTTPPIQDPIHRYVKDVFAEFKKGRIDLQPDFQRQFVWNPKKQRDLIKSLYVGVPLPMFYFAKTGPTTEEVVDGQQRLTSIFGFLDVNSINKPLRPRIISNIKLTHDGIRLELKNIKQEIRNKTIYCVTLPETLPNFKYEIFRLLNQGATALKPQEIRNCILASEMKEFNALLKTMAKSLRKMTGMPMYRMYGEELAFRFFVINRHGYEKDLSNVMNNFNALNKDFGEQELRVMKRISRHFLSVLKNIFGDDVVDCFQVLQKGNKMPKSNKWKSHIFSNTINQSLFHLLSFYIPKYTMHQLNRSNPERIKRGYLELLKNKQFIAVITGAGTNSIRNIKRSKQIFERAFIAKYLVEWSNKSDRTIKITEKRTILKNVPYCYLCYGKLSNKLPPRKVHADHIEPYVSGNTTGLQNILLTHQKCNAEKKNLILEVYRETEKSISRRTKNKKNVEDFVEKLRLWNHDYKLINYNKLRKFAKIDASTL